MRYHLQFRKRSKLIPLAGIVLLLLVTACGMVVLDNLQRAKALSAQDFNYGRIIDDAVFYNKDAMSVQQIQDFLNRLVPNCDTWGTQPSGYGNLSNAQYAQQVKGWHGPPYVCLKNYHENPSTNETSFEQGGGAFNGGLSAAQIIYNAAQQYGISPRVLLVLLKKESAGPLTADTWPLKSQYRYAMGYACPDSGPGYSANCNSEKAGFYKQTMLAAWQLKYYRDHPNDYRYKIGLNNIQYSTDPSCGTRQVNIENIATLSLYIYTPYVPNSGALANYPGTAPCGAYGNRNFFMFFREWFGTTYGNTQIDMLKADREIADVYANFQSELGPATTDRVPEFSSNIRVWQNFEKGTIIWTQDYGAYPVLSGKVYDRWRNLGGSMGSLGVPTSSPVIEVGDGRVWQNFEKGTIIWSPSTGAWEVLGGPLGDKWRSAGGSLGTLGRPTSGVIIDASGMRKQLFEKGAVARKDVKTPAYIVTGGTYSTWQDQPILKAPLMDSVHETDDGRVWQNFEKGVVIEASEGHSSAIRYGDIFNIWKQLGGSVGQLGKPTSNQTTESDGRVWQNFEKGVVVQKNHLTKPSEVLFGNIYNRWRATGGSIGELGVPQSSATTESDGRVWQNFEKGTIIWSPSTGAWEVLGGFYDFWKQRGGSVGQLGKPTSAKHIEPDNARWQDFEKARVTWRDTTGWTITLH